MLNNGTEKCGVKESINKVVTPTVLIVIHTSKRNTS